MTPRLRMAVMLGIGAGAVMALQALCMAWLMSSVAASEIGLFDTELQGMAETASTAQPALHASLKRQIDQALRERF